MNQHRTTKPQSSAWAIGVAFYDQRDLYTRNAEIDESGYGRSIAKHPKEGSYAPSYRRDASSMPSHNNSSQERRANLHEREAWPWLNYHDDPRQEVDSAADKSIWARILKLKDEVIHALHPESTKSSDERIYVDVRAALSWRLDLDATDITVNVKHGEVTLSGTVRDGYSKKIAGDIANGMRGVHAVTNRLVIRSDDDDRDSGGVFVLPLASLSLLAI